MTGDDDKVVYLEQRPNYTRHDLLEIALIKTLRSLLSVYEYDPHWLEDMGIHALIEVLVVHAANEGASGMSVLKRLAHHMQVWAADHDDDDYWSPGLARWFVKDIPAALTEYEDFKWYGDGV